MPMQPVPTLAVALAVEALHWVLVAIPVEPVAVQELAAVVASSLH